MDLSTINVWAVIAAALSTFLIGGLWYSPALFGRPWMKANGFSDDDAKQGNPIKIFGLSLVFALVMSANLAMFLAGPETTVTWGITAGVLAGLGWAALGLATIALFEHRSWPYILINGGYLTVSFAVMGGIIGAWR